MAVVLEDRNGDQQVLRFQPCVFPIPKTQKGKPASVGQYDIDTTFSGRLLSDEESRLLLYREWYRLCETQHGAKCRFPQRPSTHPSLLFDVRTRRPTSTASDARYVALSYVWGETENIRLTRRDEEQFLSRDVWTKLPQTIRDAMRVVEAMGEQFLWVDSLCIYQDDAVHKQSQISRMASIFDNAVFTIVAAAGENAHVGLWPRTQDKEHGQTPIRIGRHTLVKLLDQSFKSPEAHWNESRTQPTSRHAWASRGWTFQEILCSRRVIVFTPVQAYWHCQERDLLEETALEHAPPCAYTLNIADAETVIDFWSPDFNQFFRDTDAMLPHSCCSTEDALHCYVKLVIEYTKRYLTNPADGLNAFIGALSILRDSTNLQFLWGLPEAEFGWALAWFAPYWVLCSRSDEQSPQPAEVDATHGANRTPSWSWAAWYLDVSSKGHVSFSDFNQMLPHFPAPEITFYRKGLDGSLVLVRQRDVKDFGIPRPYYEDVVYSNRTEWYSSDDWKGQPSEIDEAITTGAPKGFIDTGILQFWTSTATLVVHRYMSEGKLQYVAIGAGFLSPFCRRWHEPGMPCYCKVDDVICVIHMGSTDHIPHGEHERRNLVSEEYKKLPRPKMTAEDEDGDLLVLDFCVVSRESRKRDFLDVLVLERGDNDIWYRSGCTQVEEITWVHVMNRRWSLITLG